MSKPISIDFAADTRQVIAETDNMAAAFAEVATSLDDLGRDADKSGSKVESSIKDAAKSVDKLEEALEDGGDAAKDMDKTISRAFESMETEAKAAAKGTRSAVQDALQDIEQEARSTGTAVESSLGRGFEGASDGVQELGEEAAGEAREMASSFDGSAESVAEMFQSLAANAFAGFGPAGAAAGLAAAVGLGMAMAKLQETAEANTEAKQSMADLGREIYATGGVMDDADLAGKIADIAFSLAEEDTWKKMGDNAETYVGMVKESMDGLEPSAARDAFQGLAGDLDAASRAQEALADANRDGKAALEDHIVSVDNYGTVIYDKEGQAILESIKNREDLAAKIEETSGVQADATGEVDYYTQIMGQSTEATEAQAEALEEARSKVQELADAQAEAAGANMGAEEAALNYAETLAQLSQDVAANGQTLDMNTEAGRANRQSLVDLADSSNSVVEALVNQGGSTEAVTARSWELHESFIQTAIAAGMGRTEAEALAASYGLVPGNVATMVQAHGTEEAKAAVESIPEAKDTDVTVSETGTGEVQAGLDSIDAPEPEVKVRETGTGQVQKSIDSIRGRDVTVNVRGNFDQFDRDLAARLQPRAMDVTVNERRGTQVNP